MTVMNFDVKKTSHKAMGHPLRKKPLCAKYQTQIRLAALYRKRGYAFIPFIRENIQSFFRNASEIIDLLYVKDQGGNTN